MRSVGWLGILWVAACGGGGGSRPPDGPPADAPLDAFVDHPCESTGATGPVIVAIPLAESSSSSAFTVLVNRPDGSLAHRRVVGPSEQSVTVDIASCDLVTLYEQVPGAEPRIATWLDAQPGDSFDRGGPAGSRIVDADIALSGVDDVSAYELQISCPRGYPDYSDVHASGVWPLSAITCALDVPAVSAMGIAMTPAGKRFSIADAVPVVFGDTTHVALPAFSPLRSVATTVLDANLAANESAYVVANATTSIGVALHADYTSVTVAQSTIDAHLPPLSVPDAPARLDIELQRIGPFSTTTIHRAFDAVPSDVVVRADEFLPVPSVELVAADVPLTARWSIDPSAPVTRAIMLIVDSQTGVYGWTLELPAEPREIVLPALPLDLPPPPNPIAFITVFDGDLREATGAQSATDSRGS